MVIFISLAFVCSCASTSPLNFAKHKWNIDSLNGDVVNEDRTICFTYGNVLVDPSMPIISDSGSVAMHKGVDKYLEKTCKNFAINVDSILYYAPLQGVLYIEYKDATPILKPSSITTNMKQNENAYTIWVRDDDVESWQRKSDEMYTNVVLNKRYKQILVLDRFTYGNKNIGRISILQTNTNHWADVTNPKYMEIVADFIVSRRNVSIVNYRKGLNIIR